MNENNYKSYELALIGDKNSDIDAGHKLGLGLTLCSLVMAQYTRKIQIATHVVPDLLRAVQHLLNLESSNRDIG